MKIFSNYEVMGDIVNIRKTHEKHFGIDGLKTSKDDNVVDSFGKMLNNAVKKVNNLQIGSDHLTQKMITEPNKVNIHEVMIAAQKAQFSLNFMKSIRDRVIRAYQTIINMR